MFVLEGTYTFLVWFFMGNKKQDNPNYLCVCGSASNLWARDSASCLRMAAESTRTLEDGKDVEEAVKERSSKRR